MSRPVGFLIGESRLDLDADSLLACVAALEKSVDIATVQYRNGETSYNRLADLQSQLVAYQDQLATAQGDVALSLIQIYKALGGGWQIRCRRLPEMVAAAPQIELVSPASESVAEPAVLPSPPAAE